MAMSLRTVILLILAVMALGFGIYEILPGRRLTVKHAELLQWAQTGPPGDFPGVFAAADYEDQWGHRARDVPERIRLARYALSGFTIQEGAPTVDRVGRSATIAQTLAIHGGEDVRSANFTFRWERSSWKPWSWRLRSVSAPDFAVE
jgi:hypothetical protein